MNDPVVGDVPRYVVAEQLILESIRSGEYAPEDRIPGELALSRKLGFGYLTIRRAVSSLVKQGVLERRQTRGTFVRSRPRTGNLALFVFHVAHLEPGRLASSEIEIIRQAAERHSRSLRATILLPPLPPVEDLVHELRTMSVGAVGLIGFLGSDIDFIRRLSAQIPCVLINKSLPGLALPCAEPDATIAARLMVDYFHRRGRQRVGLLSSNANHSLHIALEAAVEGELSRRGMLIDRSLWRSAPDYGTSECINRWVDETAASPTRPDALIVPGWNRPARLALRLAERGERLGREMDAIGLCNCAADAPSGEPWPMLVWNHEDAAQYASDMLLRIVENENGLQGAPVRKSTPRLLVPSSEGQPATEWQEMKETE
jgi:DNA-binding LacI/PurR family transcriptional regulator